MFLRKIDDELSLALVSSMFADGYFERMHAQKAYLGEWLRTPHLVTDSDMMKQRFANGLENYAKGICLPCLIFRKTATGQELVGDVILHSIDSELKKAAIGCFVFEQYQGQNIASRSVKAMLTIAKNELKLEWIEAHIAEGNHKSRKTAEKAGFVQQGIIKNEQLINGRLLTLVLYGYDLSQHQGQAIEPYFTQKIDEELSLALPQKHFAQSLFEIIHRQRDYLGEWLPWAVNYQDDESSFHARYFRGFADGSRLNCLIIYHGHIVGSVSMHNIDHRLKRMQMGYWLSQDYQGKGIMTRAVNAMLTIAKEDYQLQLAEIRVAPNNIASRAIPERLGFSLDSIIKNAVLVNGQILDHVVYSLDLTNEFKS